MPTLVEEATGEKIPVCPRRSADSRRVDLCVEGTSLSPLLRDPATPWSEASFSQFPRPEHPNSKPDLTCKTAADCPDKMGYSIRVHNYRYTEWIGEAQP